MAQGNAHPGIVGSVGSGNIPFGTTPSPFTVTGSDELSWDTTNKSFEIKGKNPWADVKAWGAVGDGTTDDTTAIQNAINSFSSGGIVWFPPGTYKITSALTMTTTHIQLRGASKTDCTIITNSATADMLVMNSWYCSAEDLTFNTSVTRTAGYAIKMETGNNRHVVRNCEFNSQFNGIRMQSHLSVVDECEFRTFANGGSWIELSATASAAHDFYINRVTGDNGAANKNAASTQGILINQCASLVLENCNLVNGGANGAMNFAPGAGQTIPSIYCANTFFDQSGHGVLFSNNATGTVQRVKFSQCWFSSHTNDGVRMNSSNSVGLQGVDFVNCDFHQNVNGINALAGYQDWMVSGSRFSGNTTTGILTTAVSTGGFNVLGNFIGNGSGFGANALGMNIQAGTYGNYQVTSNRGLASNTTGGITNNGSVTGQSQMLVEDNVGGTLNGKLGSIVAATAGLNTTETILVGGLNVSPVPANSLQVGDVIRFELWGTNTSTVANTTTIRVRMGTAGTTGDTAIWTGVTPVSAVTGTNQPFRLVGTLIIRTLGAAATTHGSMELINTSVTSNATASTGISVFSQQLVVPTFATWSTATANYISLTHVTAAATTTNTFQGGFLELV